jgi:arylsulfatase A
MPPFNHIKKSLKFIVWLFAGTMLQAQAPQPNIIFILADDLGYGDLGCYGQKKIATPHIDQLAREGMRFTDFYAGNTVCAPSRCSLITGKHPGRASVRGNFEIGHWDSYLGQLPIPKSDTTIFEMLKQKGYATACYGKWGLGHAASSGAPNERGVDDFFGYNCQRHAHSYYPHYLEGNGGAKIWLEGNNRKDGGAHYSQDLIAEKGLEFIKANQNRPFFLYLPFTLPHTPFMVPKLGQYAANDWDEAHKKQAAMISYLDKDVGRVMALLKELKLEENTIVIFCSDNGAHGDGGTVEFFKASGPLRGSKFGMYEGGIRTPMIVRWKGKIKPNSTSDHIGAFWDVMPTLAEITGGRTPGNTDGISFLPELLGKTQPKHHFLYWEFHQGSKTKLVAIRKGPWKGIRSYSVQEKTWSPVQLYNLTKDIAESTNVASENPVIVEEIIGLMKASHVPTDYFKFY